MYYTVFYADCYILTTDRTLEMVDKFLNHFLPERAEVASEYELPQFGETTELKFDTVEGLIEYLVINTSTPYSIYWCNKVETDIKCAMCFFTDDNHLILGLSCNTLDHDNSVEDEIFRLLKNYGKTSSGYITYENPAPTNAQEFQRIIKRMSKS